METHVKSQPNQELSISARSLSSSSSSTSSSSCYNVTIVPRSFSTVQTKPQGTRPPYDHGTNHDDDQLLENGEVYSMAAGSAIDNIEGLRFIDIMGNGGMEWKNVEERFNQLAFTQNSGHEPLMKWSDFGICIGMQQSPEFANELLRALRATRDWKFHITKCELHCFWCRMMDPSFDSRIRIFFDMCDRDMDGRITKMKIKQTILLSASTNKLSLTHEEAECYATLVMEVLDTENLGYIELSQFKTLFKVYLSRGSIQNNQLSINTHSPYHIYHNDPFQEPLSKAEGAAETLKFNMALILLPVCRNTITWFRKHRWINSIVPFNDNINFHKMIAGAIVIGVILHGGTHLACDFPRISESDHTLFRQTIAAGFGYHQPTYIDILCTTEVATGIAMVILMTIAFSLATKRPRRQSPSLPRSVRRVTGYNTFWYSHHLFILVYALLIIHSLFLFLTDKLNEKTTWMYIAIPVLLYVGERIFRAIRSGLYEVEILKASIYPGKVLSLKLQKPEGFKYHSGMYIFIQCPHISTFEWHPFSLTSGPEDDYLSVHIRTLGDWSYNIYNLFQEAKLSGPKECPRIYIDGPYGAASQDHVKYDIVVLIGLGIGATPFLSILKDVANSNPKAHFDHTGCRDCSIKKGPLKSYLYWITREQSSFDWFRDVMKEISNSNQQQSVIEMHNFLTNVHQEGDVRSALISAIQALYHAKNGIDFLSGTPGHTHFARPNWFNIFSKLARQHRGTKIGVFYCGPSALARELERLCIKFSTKTSTRFVFHKENY
nr:respiratory burst oxidase like protein a [Quercus suber]